VRNKIEAMQLLFMRSFFWITESTVLWKVQFLKKDSVPKFLSQRQPKKTKKETSKKELIELRYKE
jgi:hypothetical protein